MKIPSPGELGLPEKFEAWRPNQIEALRRLRTATQRVKALAAPTGFGKTAVYVADALMSGQPTAFVTESRALQDQLMRDYESVGMVDLKGRANYTCDLRPDYTCEDGKAARCPKWGQTSCPASQANMRAATSTLVSTNYAKWCHTRMFGQGLQHITRVVFDEGHTAPEALARAMQVTLNGREIEDTLELDFPDHGQAEDFVNWKPWAQKARLKAEIEASRAQQFLRDMGPNARSTDVRHFLHMRNLERKLATLATARADNWIVDGVERGYQFDPVRVGAYAEGALLLRVPDITMVSATLRPKTLFMLGISQVAFSFQEYPSDFDPARCPIYYIPTVRVDSRNPDLSMLWVRLDQIAARRRDRNGIVHTISHLRRKAVLDVSRFSDSMIFNDKGEATGERIEEFLGSYPGSILVSPSVGAGYDFPGRACEWQFVCKIPFPDSRSKIVRARQEADKEYGPYQAMNKLVQIFGRGMRFPQDQCENFIGDMHLDWFLPRWGYLAPKWFHGFFKRLEIPPAPPPRLEV